MAKQTLRFHLSSIRAGSSCRLSDAKPTERSFVALRVDLADRSDADRVVPGGGVVDSAVDTWNGLEFVSDPLTEPTELSGLFSGKLDFIANKKGFCFNFALHWLTPQDEYID